MKKLVIIIPIIVVIVGIGVAIVTVHLPIIQHMPEQHILHCIRPSMDSIPHMKWNCYYFNK
ncbi:MAG: hypothetical protein ACREBB_06110 [Nitrosotalea sp.]